MKPETAFDIDIQDCSVHQLLPEDSAIIQELWEDCLDYMLLVDGHPAGPHSGEEGFEDVPPGKSPADLFLFGIVNQQGHLVGMLEVLRGYPDEMTWWIGVLLIVPEARSQGIGQTVVQGFMDYVRLNGGQAIMLGVVDENTLAYKFWSRMGFEFVRQTEPRQFGNKTHTVSVMRLQV